MEQLPEQQAEKLMILELGETEWSSRISAMRQTTSPILCNVHLSEAANPRGWRYNLYRYVSTSWTTLKLGTCDPQNTKHQNHAITYNPLCNQMNKGCRNTILHGRQETTTIMSLDLGTITAMAPNVLLLQKGSNQVSSESYEMLACLTWVGGPPRKHFSTIMKCSKKEFLWFKWITAASRHDTDGRVYSIQRQLSLQSSSWFRV